MTQTQQNNVPKLRFPEFRDAGDWEEKPLAKLISTITPPKKLLTTDYSTSGSFPIIDQSQDFICGWTNDDEALIHYTFPLIVFGDHTCVLKLVKRPFVQGADGIKIFGSKENVTVDFLYQFLKFSSLEMKGYRRHFSILKEKKIYYPDINSGEQQKIAACLTSLDDLITAQTQKLAALKTYKKGLMQQLFPAEGETVPKLRFPEFRGTGDWEECMLGDCLSRHPEYGINAPAVPYSAKLPTYLRITDISEEGYFIRKKKVSVAKKVNEENYLCKGDIALARTGASVGKSYKYKKMDGELVFAGFLIRVRPDEEKLSSELLFQFFSTEQYWRWVDFSSARSGQPGINGNEYASLPIQLPPNLEEQQKIADFLSSIDELIAAQTKKVAALKTYKKGLMQQMFV